MFFKKFNFLKCQAIPNFDKYCNKITELAYLSITLTCSLTFYNIDRTSIIWTKKK